MEIREQMGTLLKLGVPELAGLSATAFEALAEGLPSPGIVVVAPRLVPPRLLATLMVADGKAGFVVEDLTDLEEFTDQVDVPDRDLYVVDVPDRGDDLRNWSPDEAMPELATRGRSPLTVSEGISWLLQQPDRLERNACFMCVGTRRRTPKGLDSRTPAIWLSNGAGRDGKQRRNAPKVGWCWAGNRHTWLGFASTQQRKA
jgi:hypothetical protein